MKPLKPIFILQQEGFPKALVSEIDRPLGLFRSALVRRKAAWLVAVRVPKFATGIDDHPGLRSRRTASFNLDAIMGNGFFAGNVSPFIESVVGKAAKPQLGQ